MNRLIYEFRNKTRWLIVGFAVFSLSLSIFGSKPAGQSIEPAAVDDPLYEIPFEVSLNKIILPVSINGSKPIKCILDTGMVEGVFIMNPGSADGLNLEYSGTNVMLKGGGSGSSSAKMALGTKWEMGGVLFDNQRVIVMNDEGALAYLGIDGVIGASIFNKYVVRFDLNEKVLRLYSPDNFDSSEAGESFDLTITATKPVFSTALSIDGVKELPVSFVVDTGAGMGIMLRENTEKGLTVPEKSIDGVFGFGVGGDVNGQAARIGRVKLGNMEIKHPVVQFSNDHVMNNADGVVGMQLLKRFRVTFDYSGKKMFLKPNPDFAEPFEFSMLGFNVKPNKDGSISVIGVHKDSSAEQAGILSGDKIVSVDNKAQSFIEFSEFNESLKTPGKSVAVVFERNGARRSVNLTLKRLL